jgi:hypothetical protein
VFLDANNGSNERDGFVFSYAITLPGKTWEGSQGFVYVKKVNGKCIIVGLDTVP